MQPKLKVLVAPLDWGLGHASRCVPIIRQLLQSDVIPVIAGSGRSLKLLQTEFPNLQFIELKGMQVTIPRKGLLMISLLCQLPAIVIAIIREHLQLKKIIAKHQIDIVISDNRYGLYNQKVYTVFVTHQLRIAAPLAEQWIHKLHMHFIKKFNHCWVPDFSGPNNLAGKLSYLKNIPSNITYIGPLSRFSPPINTVRNFQYDLLILLSGPEPQRTNLETQLLKQLHTTTYRWKLVQGKPELQHHPSSDERIIPYLSATQLEKLINDAELIVCRSGYSTIMDLKVLGKKALFIPTPGQTEQEYLAKLYQNNKIAFTMPESNLHLKMAVSESENYKGFKAR